MGKAASGDRPDAECLADGDDLADVVGGVVGDQGGFLSGVGGILRWDSRDHSLAPRAGGVLSFSPRIYRRGLGSDYDFGRLLVDGSWFFGLGGSYVVAFDGRGDFRTGDPPFQRANERSPASDRRETAGWSVTRSKRRYSST